MKIFLWRAFSCYGLSVVPLSLHSYAMVVSLPQLRTESPTTVASERLRRHYYPGGAFA